MKPIKIELFCSGMLSKVRANFDVSKHLKMFYNMLSSAAGFCTTKAWYFVIMMSVV
ncbi:hypothetical protein [Mariniphaga anaerophila]|uniref:hypothetical protein n=1 Tax=Mariniphaga anaerophila TaxID=1484053 RepID=UPI001C3165D5|nr:hypothetical protein [Mariniphaga anaerophila]